MRVGEFMKLTGINSKHTAYWVYNHLHTVTENGTIKDYTQDDVDWVLSRKPENFKGNLKQVPNYPKYYASDDGVIYFYTRGFLEELKGWETRGYIDVELHNDAGKWKTSLARVIAMVFIPNPDEKATVNHKDGNKLNNAVSNLEWATQSENNQHAYNTGLRVNDKGFDNTFSDAVLKIDMTGKPLDVYGSICEAARLTGLSKGTIHYAVKHNTSKFLSGEKLSGYADYTFIYYNEDVRNKINDKSSSSTSISK